MNRLVSISYAADSNLFVLQFHFRQRICRFVEKQLGIMVQRWLLNKSFDLNHLHYVVAFY